MTALIWALSKNLYVLKNPNLLVFCSYFKLCETIGSSHLKAQILHFGAKLTGGQVFLMARWLGTYIITDWSTVSNTNVLKTSDLHVALDVIDGLFELQSY